ncbi:MAG: T9SS type A sorting domain-containing protein [Crocinitomicaceae bacterium]|nr:T9SS type A sorting domain-containing protein [Crocinitomicaceae bacterium]
MKLLLLITTLFFSYQGISQSWQAVGPGNQSNSTHGLLTWNGLLVDLGSFNNNPCDRVATWDGTSWSCLAGGVGIVARAGVVWDGKLVVVGDFWNNFQPCVGCNGVAVWDGVSWSPLGNGVNNDVLTCTVWNNELVIGGDMTQADGVPVARIAKWNGTIWESVGPIGSFSNDIRCMTEFEGELWVGGDFNNVGGTGSHDGVVKYDPNTAGWTGGNSGVDLVGGVNESVRVLYVNPNDGNLYMGGEFPELIDGNVGVQDFDMGGIAMYDGSDWTSLGTGLNEYCRAIHEYNGDIIAGGYFTDAGGTPANKIAKWDGTNWSAMGLGFDASGIDEYVKAATTWNGIFFAGGAYTQAEGNPMNYIAQWYEPATSPPVAWMTPSSTTLCGSGCIDFVDNSTNGPTSWNWTFPGSSTPTSTDQDPLNICWTSPGTYTVSLQACNAIGCTTQDMDIEVTNGATVSVNDESLCGAGPVTLTATPSDVGGTFLWSPGGETTGSISVNPGTTTDYTVTYSYLGCTSMDVGTVTVGVGPAVGLTTSSSICLGQTTTLVATPSVGGGTYLWMPTGEVTASIDVSPLVTTAYTVEYTLSGCTSPIETSTITVVTAYNEVDNPLICSGDNFTYPDGTTVTNVVASETHVSNLTSSNGCDSIVTSNLTVTPDYNLNDAVSVCSGNDFTYPDGSTSTNITANETHVSNLISAAGCDSIITSNLTVNPIYNSNEAATICQGASITYPDGSSEVITANTTHLSSLTSVAGCDSTIMTTVTVGTIYSVTDNQDLCSGANFMYPDGATSTNVTVNESHVSNLSAINGCDSTVTTNLTVITAYNLVDNPSICSGGNYTYPDGATSTNILANETHVSNLISSNGCDSIVTSNLSVAPDYNLSDAASICSGSNYTYPDGSTSTNITANETHISNLTSVAGCDSIITSNLTVNPIYNSNESATVCPGTTVVYPDGSSEVITANTSHTSSLTTMNGCDSTIMTNVTVGAIFNITDNQDICAGANYVYPDGSTSTNVTANESHVSNLTTAGGCDSIITTSLNVVAAYAITDDVNICSGDNYTYPDGMVSTNISVSESHVSSLTSSTGCDSIITSNITVAPDYNLSESASICSGSNYTYPDGSTSTNITANETHISNLTSATGCDSIITSNLTVNPIFNLNESVTTCPGTTVVYPDGTSEVITANTTHTSSLTTINGCDSTVLTNVTVGATYNVTDNQDLCSGTNYTYPDGSTSTNVTANESHISNVTTVNGCDSTVTTNLTVVTAYNMTQNENVCSGENYTYPDGTTVTNVVANETHVSNLISLNGCDSIITSNINVAPDYNLSTSPSICSGSNYTYPDGSTSTNITANETHISNLTSAAGCDSIITSNLTVNPIYNSNESVTACPGTTVMYPDGSSEVITANTAHTSSLATVNGCDSTVVTNVTVGATYNVTDNQDLCSGANYTYPDGSTSTNVTANESHVSNVTTVNGCDSTVTTNLTVVTAYVMTDDVNICSGDSYTYPDGTASTNITNDESHVSNLVSSTGCDSTITSNLTVNDPFNGSENISVCGFTSITYPDGSTESITASTTHTSNLTSTAGCDSIIITNVTFNDIYSITDEISLCVGDNHTYPDGTASTNILVDESHTSNLTSAAGCDSTITTNITIITAIDNTVSELNTVLTASQGGATYQWVDCNDGNAPINGETGQVFTPTANGSYAVEITAGGCSDISTCTVITTIGLDELSSLGFTVHPNPTTGTIWIDGNEIILSSYEIIDATGRVLMKGELDENQMINMHELTPGSYIIRFGDIGMIRIVKE